MTDPTKPEMKPAPSERATPADPTFLEFKGSTNMKSARFDALDSSATVTFSDGGVYKFGGFTLELMKSWSEAKSAGGWFHANVRQHPDKYPQLSKAPAPGAPKDPPTPPAPIELEKPVAKPAAPKAAPVATKPPRAKRWWLERPWRKHYVAPPKSS